MGETGILSAEPGKESAKPGISGNPDARPRQSDIPSDQSSASSPIQTAIIRNRHIHGQICRSSYDHFAAKPWRRWLLVRSAGTRAPIRTRSGDFSEVAIHESCSIMRAPSSQMHQYCPNENIDHSEPPFDAAIRSGVRTSESVKGYQMPARHWTVRRVPRAGV